MNGTKLKSKGQRDLVAVVGNLPSANPGEWITAQGRWVQDREFGLQFKADALSASAPTSKEGIEKYLGSGMVKGIGPVYAKKLVKKYGESCEIFGQPVDSATEANTTAPNASSSLASVTALGLNFGASPQPLSVSAAHASIRKPPKSDSQ